MTVLNVEDTLSVKLALDVILKGLFSNIFCKILSYRIRIGAKYELTILIDNIKEGLCPFSGLILSQRIKHLNI